MRFARSHPPDVSTSAGIVEVVYTVRSSSEQVSGFGHQMSPGVRVELGLVPCTEGDPVQGAGALYRGGGHKGRC